MSIIVVASSSLLSILPFFPAFLSSSSCSIVFLFFLHFSTNKKKGKKFNLITERAENGKIGFSFLLSFLFLFSSTKKWQFFFTEIPIHSSIPSFRLHIDRLHYEICASFSPDWWLCVYTYMCSSTSMMTKIIFLSCLNYFVHCSLVELKKKREKITTQNCHHHRHVNIIISKGILFSLFFFLHLQKEKEKKWKMILYEAAFFRSIEYFIFFFFILPFAICVTWKDYFSQQFERYFFIFFLYVHWIKSWWTFSWFFRV